MAWAPDYAGLDDLAAYLRVPAGDVADDPQMQVALTSASRQVDNETRRQFGQLDAAALRRYDAVWRADRGRWVVPVDDLMSTTDLAVTTTDGAVDLYELEPVNAAADGRPWTRLVVDPDATNPPTATGPQVDVVAVWGWSGFPAPVVQATLLQASRLLSRRDSPFGIAGSPEGGDVLRLLARVDADVAVLLRPYTRRAKPR